MQKLINAGVTEPNAGSTDRTPLLNVFIQGKIGMQVGLPPTVGQIKDKNAVLQVRHRARSRRRTARRSRWASRTT